MKTNTQRINNVIGQLNGICKMIDDGEDQFKVVTQMKAARSALNSVMTNYMEENFWDFMNQCSNKEKSCRNFLSELINNT